MSYDCNVLFVADSSGRFTQSRQEGSFGGATRSSATRPARYRQPVGTFRPLRGTARRFMRPIDCHVPSPG
ncbi:MAG: hypothetical protein JWO70_3599, partial [Betaproteobacteria bacterium]|nr:hypothetical protein [Betaproteobacteria bacterium]